MPIHKLANGPITMTVAKTEIAPSQFDQGKFQVKFVSTTDDIVYVSEQAANMQLGRLNLMVDDCAGKTLRFEQVKKDGRTYTNIGLAAPGSETAAAPAAAAASAPRAAVATSMTLEQATAIYTECVKTAIATLGQQCISAEIPVDASAIQAAAATLFIRVTK